MIYFILQQEEKELPLYITIITITFIILISIAVIFLLFKIIELLYIQVFNKPLVVYTRFNKKVLNKQQRQYLLKESEFYKKLKPRYKLLFQNRVVRFIEDKEFIGRDGVVITDESKLLIASTAIMLTFGFRHYMMYNIDKIIIYPKVFYSSSNNDYHKGEFNPHLKAIVFSWEDFVYGFKISNDNLNLGIHEFSHVLHIDSVRSSSETAIIFGNGFNGITKYLEKNESIRKRLLESDYIRNYAYTNQFEFVAVVIEAFIETPMQFKAMFPELYKRVKKMLNFNFSGY